MRRNVPEGQSRRNMVITLRSERYLRAYEIVKVEDKTYRFTCNLKEGSATMGFNTDLCVSVFSDRGWTSIIDNRMLNVDVSSPSYGYAVSGDETETGPDDIVSSLESVFARFEEYVYEIDEAANITKARSHEACGAGTETDYVDPWEAKSMYTVFAIGTFALGIGMIFENKLDYAMVSFILSWLLFGSSDPERGTYALSRFNYRVKKFRDRLNNIKHWILASCPRNRR